MRYRLRTLLLLLALAPPLIGYWPAIQKRVAARIAQWNASDVVVVGAVASLTALRYRLSQK